MLHKKQKALTQTHKKASPPQRPKPHHLMKCEKGTWRSHVPFSHFGGCGGGFVPPQKKTNLSTKIRFHRACGDVASFDPPFFGIDDERAHGDSPF